MKKRNGIAAAFTATLTLLATACANDRSQPAEAEPVMVRVLEATTARDHDSHTYSGTVEEKNGTPLSFNNGGTVCRVLVSVGDPVRKGQLLAMTDTTQASDAVQMAQAQLRQAQDAFDRMKQLHDAGSLPDIKWVETVSKVDQARIQEKMARKHLSDCRLVAPISGVVAQRNAEAGQVVAPSATVITIVTANDLEVSISVPESEVRDVRLGQRAAISIDAVGAESLSGVVSERGVKADPLSRSYTVKLRLQSASEAILPGMVATVRMEREAGDTSFVIPTGAVLLADDNTNFVWIDQDGTAVRRKVTCTGFTASGVSVGSGLSEGDKVIVDGQHKVCTGTKVNTAN